MRCDQRSVTLSTRDWSPLICLSCVNHNNSETKSKLDMQIPCYVFQQLKRNGQIHFMTRPWRQKSPINVFFNGSQKQISLFTNFLNYLFRDKFILSKNRVWKDIDNMAINSFYWMWANIYLAFTFLQSLMFLSQCKYLSKDPNTPVIICLRNVISPHSLWLHVLFCGLAHKNLDMFLRF